MPVPDLQVRAPHGRSQTRPGGQLAGAGKPADIADLGHHHQRGELPDPRQRPEHLDPRVGLGMLVQLAVQPLDHRRQAVDDRRAVRDDLPRRRRQIQLGQPAPSRPGSVTGGPVTAVVGGHRVDPVTLPGAEPDQAGPVPQQRAELPNLWRGEPRLREQVRAQQLRQDRGVDLVVLQPGRSDRLAPQRGAPGAPRSRNLPAVRPASSSRMRPRTPPACQPAGPRSAAAAAPSRSPCSCSAAPFRPR